MQTIERFYYDILSEQASNYPEHEAIVMGEARLTYQQLISKIDNVASTLLSKGLKKATRLLYGEPLHQLGFILIMELSVLVVSHLF